LQHFLARRKKLLRTALLILVVLIPCFVVSARVRPHHAYASGFSEGSFIKDVNTDKARYKPGDTVTTWVELTNNSGQSINNGGVVLYYKHLGTIVGTGQPQTLNLSVGATTNLSWQWTPPSTDYQGYSVEAWVYDSSSNLLDNLNTAVDVSSDWVKYPRYGFLADFPSQDGATSYHDVWQLKNYHIDGLQYYSWEWKHHIPLDGTVSNPASSWPDIQNRTISRQTVLDYLDAAHSYNMLSFAYNPLNTAYADYANDGVSPSWGLYNNSNCTNQFSYPLPSSFATPALDLFDPSNSGWQNYLFNNENQMFAAYPFDGWHVDIVNWGTEYTCSGQSLYDPSTYPGFLNNAKSSTGKRILFNNSYNTELNEVAQQTSDDALYNEWYSSKTYYSLKQDVDSANGLSNKSLITAAYLDTNNSGSNFNTPGVLLADASIFAAGGDHIELGDGLNMLNNGNFTSHPLGLSSDLQRQLRNYYDFMVAYEELLRGGLANTSNTVQLSAGGNNLATSTNSSPNTVYEFSKSGNGYDTINLVNLLGEGSNDAFDANGNYPVPNAQSNISVKYYYGSGTVNSVSVASPDDQNGKTYTQNFSTGSDGGGNYVTFTIPSLTYWDLIYVNKS
jgi:dextranase